MLRPPRRLPTSALRPCRRQQHSFAAVERYGVKTGAPRDLPKSPSSVQRQRRLIARIDHIPGELRPLPHPVETGLSQLRRQAHPPEFRPHGDAPQVMPGRRGAVRVVPVMRFRPTHDAGPTFRGGVITRFGHHDETGGVRDRGADAISESLSLIERCPPSCDVRREDAMYISWAGRPDSEVHRLSLFEQKTFIMSCSP